MEQNYKQLFVGGDLSGIQKFLYNISSKKAAVSLKGRSAFLNDFLRGVCNRIEDTIQGYGSSFDELYCSGGKFYLLTDNKKEICAAIDECTKLVQKNLWKEHMGQLGICICYIPFTENADRTINTDGLENQKPGYLWKIINECFHRQKNQKFKNLLTDDFDGFFEPLPVGGQVRVCAVTGIESPDCISYEDMYVLPSVYDQIQKGKQLQREQGFKTFEEYAKDTKLGVLRMDVDGLGKRFEMGFNSIQDYKAFSKRLVEFFENETDKIQKENEFYEFLNIIYAGGDDLFVVGRWDKVADFAERIHKEVDACFSKDDITISGGMSIVNPKFPIAKAAELAGNAEDSAKQYHSDKYGEKNAFCLFGKTMSWEEEFEIVKYYRDKFVSLIKNYDLSKSILHKIMLYSSIADQNLIRRKEGKSEDYSYIWHVSYYLTRYINRYKSNEEISKFCRDLRDKQLDYKKPRRLELISLAARWAELKLKDINKLNYTYYELGQE